MTNLRFSELGLDSAVTEEIYYNPHDQLYCPLSIQKKKKKKKLKALKIFKFFFI